MNVIPWKQCGTACITKIVKERHEEPVIVYNLAVKDWISYFVWKVWVYVHNRKNIILIVILKAMNLKKE